MFAQKINDPPKAKKKFNFRLQWGDKIVLVLVGILLLYGLKYNIVSVKKDLYNIDLSILVSCSYILVLICIIGLAAFRSLWHLIFIILIVLNLYIGGAIKEKDQAKTDALVLELSKSEHPFPKFLSKEQSERGPEFQRMVYLKIEDESFSFFMLVSSDVYRRNYPIDKGWEYMGASVVSEVLFDGGNRPESEREKELDKILNKMKDDDPLKKMVMQQDK